MDQDDYPNSSNPKLDRQIKHTGAEWLGLCILISFAGALIYLAFK